METELDPIVYQPMIDAILGVADLEQISAKKIRSALQELFSIDLSPHKKQLNDFIVQRFHALQEKLDHENEDDDDDEDAEVETKNDQCMREQNDRTLAHHQLKSEANESTRAKTPKTLNKLPSSKSIAKVSKGSGQGSSKLTKGKVTKGSGKVTKGKVTKDVTKRKEKSRDPNKKSAFHVELLVSNPLQQVVGQEHMSRPMVVKRLWEYIKEHELQDSNDRRRINCDDKLQAVFKKTFVGMFEMNRLLGSHLFKDEELVEPRKFEDMGLKTEVKAEVKAEPREPREPKNEYEVKDEFMDGWKDEDELSELED